MFTTDDAAGYAPVFFWTRVRRGCEVLAARVLIGWRRVMAQGKRLTDQIQENESTISGGTLYA